MENIKSINLEFLFNHTKDVIWSVDKDINLICSNKAFDNFVHDTTGKFPKPGESVLHKEYGKETNAFWLNHYKRVLAGERFSFELDNNGGENQYGEVTLDPILDEQGNIIGAGCFVRDITAYKLSEIALKKANDEIEKREQRYKAVIQNSHDVIVLISDKGIREYVSPSSSKILGYLPEELINQPITQHIHPDDLIILQDKFKYVMANPDDDAPFTLRFRHKDGRWIYLGITGSNQFHNPAINALVVSLRDITELVLAEQKALKNEDYFRSLTENFPNGAMCVLGTDFKVRYAAGEDFKIFDIDPKSMLGAYYPSYYGADKQEFIEEQLGQILSGKSVNYELPFQDSHYLISGQPLYDSEGQILEIILLAQNITQQSNAKAQLRESEQKFRNVSEYSPVGIFQVELNGYCTWMNGRMAEIFGFSNEEGLGFNYLQYVHPKYLNKIKQTWEKHSNRFEATPKLAYEIITSKNEKKWAQTQAIPLKDKFGNVTSYLATIEDITEIKHYQDKIIESKNQQEKILNGMPNAVLYIDTEWTITYVNDKAIKKLNLTKDELIGWNVWKRFDEAKDTSLHKLFLQAKKDKKPFNTIRFYKRLKIWLEIDIVPDNGGLLVYFKNISAKVELESQLELIYKTSFDVIGIAQDGYFANISPSLSKLLGFTEDELKSKPLLQFVHPEDLKRTTSASKSLLKESSKLVSFENRYIKKNGGLVWLSWNCISDAKRATVYFIARDITEKKKEEEYLRMLESVVTNTKDAVLITLADNIDIPGPEIVYVNQAFTDQTGYTQEETIGKTPRILQGAKTSKSELTRFKRALRSKEPFTTELINYTKDGTEFWINISVEPVFDPKGKLTHFISIQRDVTKIKLAELKLLAFAKQQESLASLGSSIVWLDDLEQIFTICIQSASLILDTEISIIALIDKDTDVIKEAYSSGIPKENLNQIEFKDNSIIGHCIKNGSQLVSSDLSSITIQKIPSVISKAKAKSAVIVPLVIDARVFGAMGIFSIKPREYSIDETNYIKAVANILSSAIERVEAQRKIKFSERKYRIIFEENSIPSWVYDPETFQFTDVNDAAIKQYGYSREEYLKMKITDLGAPEEISELVNAIKNSSTNTDYRKLWKHYKKSGEEIYTEISWNSININDKVFGLKLANDVTRTKELEEVRAKYQEELELIVQKRTVQLVDSNRELEAFNYTVSHDLRTPIRAIQMFATLFEQESNGDKNLLEYAHNIKACTSEMSNLIDDLLEFSRLRNQPLELKKVDMANLARTISEYLLSLDDINKNNIKIGKLHTALCDQSLIKSVWQNLISNAIKYSNKKTVVNITISSTKKDGWITYCVEDNGVGFDMKYIDKLFKPFSRLHSSSEYKGTGAGLAIVERIITRHGGKVFATSTPNVGSKFYFALPEKK